MPGVSMLQDGPGSTNAVIISHKRPRTPGGPFDGSGIVHQAEGQAEPDQRLISEPASQTGEDLVPPVMGDPTTPAVEDPFASPIEEPIPPTLNGSTAPSDTTPNAPPAEDPTHPPVEKTTPHIVRDAAILINEPPNSPAIEKQQSFFMESTSPLSVRTQDSQRFVPQSPPHLHASDTIAHTLGLVCALGAPGIVHHATSTCEEDEQDELMVDALLGSFQDSEMSPNLHDSLKLDDSHQERNEASVSTLAPGFPSIQASQQNPSVSQESPLQSPSCPSRDVNNTTTVSLPNVPAVQESMAHSPSSPDALDDYNPQEDSVGKGLDSCAFWFRTQ